MRIWIYLSGFSFTSMLLFASAIDPAGSWWPIPLLGSLLSLLAAYVCYQKLPKDFWLQDNCWNRMIPGSRKGFENGCSFGGNQSSILTIGRLRKEKRKSICAFIL